MSEQHPASIPRMRHSQEPTMTTSSTTLYEQLRNPIPAAVDRPLQGRIPFAIQGVDGGAAL